MSNEDRAAGVDESAVRRSDAARSVTAFFDTKDDAEIARRDLVQAGISDEDIHVVGGEAALETSPAQPHGFWASLKELFLPDEDHFAYAEGLRRGGYTVSVRTDEARYDEALDILDRDGAVDMDEREASWRDEGWAGGPAPEEEPAYRPAGAGTAGFGASAADHFPKAEPIDESGGTTLNPGSKATPETAYVAAAPGLGVTEGTATAPLGAEPVPQVTRDFSHSRSRVRSYIRDRSGEDGGPIAGVEP